LQYTYDAQNPNLLLKVFDYSNSPQGFKDDGDGINDHENDYKYDSFGNLIKDDNKNIESITYNHLNLPVKIIFHNGNISYLYTATGQKIKKVVSSRETITTDYLGSFQYFNNNLKHIPHAEGYVNVVNGKFKHVFNFTDHLGNIRLSYSDANRDNLITHDEILEENNFYPFGLKHTAYNTNERQYINNDQINELILILFPRFTGDGRYNYKYNGKEYQDELGLNMYDYGARNYDPALGRWMNIDPLAEEYRRWSPYNYVMNSPMRFVDPDGMKVSYGDYIDNAGHESKTADSESPPDDITVNKEGIVTNVVRNDKPNKFFDQNGKEINFNDIAEVDVDMKSYTFNVGDRLFTNISRDELNELIIKGGLEPLQYNKKFYNSFGFGYFKLMAYKHAISNSKNIKKSDFTFSTLLNYSESLPNSRGEKYFTFGNQSTMYNLYDAGNFMWGYWMRFSLFTYKEARIGSQLHEFYKDSEADQRAIKNAYKF